jgi:hypothetical protein
MHAPYMSLRLEDDYGRSPTGDEDQNATQNDKLYRSTRADSWDVSLIYSTIKHFQTKNDYLARFRYAWRT